MKRRAFIKAAAAAGALGMIGNGDSLPAKELKSAGRSSRVHSFRKNPPEAAYQDDKAEEPAIKLSVATCQFPITGNIEANCSYVLKQMRFAKREGAHAAHFPEGSLGGYAGGHFDSFDTYDWNLLRQCTLEIMKEAGNLKLWIIIGSNHRLSGNNKPHNSLYVINDCGEIVDRYDKMFCTGNREETSGDLKYYSPGSHFVVFNIKGITCGLLICHDMRYQELYREYKKFGVQLLFHSYHNGDTTKEFLEKSGNIHAIITPPTMQAYAANNYMWISANNTSKRESCWASFFVYPNGVISGRLTRNEEGVLLSVVDTGQKYYDASVNWRDRAMKGIYHSGTIVHDRRSDNRICL